MTTEQRLDTVEDDLDVVKKLLVSAARYAESANQGLDQLTERFDDLAAAQTNTQARIDSLTSAQDRTQVQLDRLGFRVDQLVESQAQTQTQLDQLGFRVDQLFEAQDRTQTQLDQLGFRVDQLVASQVQTQTQLDQLTQKVDQLTERVDSFVYHAQRLFTALGERLVPVEGQTERFEPVIRMLARNYEAQQSQLQEFQVTTRASLERIDRILDYLLKQSGGSND